MTKVLALQIVAERDTENADLDFKSQIDLANDGEVLELIKDMVAIANTGGGLILIGVNDDGTCNESFEYNLQSIDNATIINKIRKYTNVEFSGFEMHNTSKSGKDVLCLNIEPARRPIAFEKPGTYPNPKDPKGQKTAFGQGTVYFRHGSKSETCNNQDLSKFGDSELDRIRESWLGNIRKVVEAPFDHVVKMLPPNVVMRESIDATAIRITDDENAPKYKIENPDDICPFRQKDVVQRVNSLVSDDERINQYDIQSIIHVYNIDDSKPNYYYKSLFGPKQYSAEFVKWIIDQYKEDPLFFIKTREKYRHLMEIQR